MNTERRMVETVLNEMCQEHKMQCDICHLFAMDAIMLEHYDLLGRINRQADKHHAMAMATFEVHSRLAK